jgi:hypothetical protein
LNGVLVGERIYKDKTTTISSTTIIGGGGSKEDDIAHFLHQTMTSYRV